MPNSKLESGEEKSTIPSLRVLLFLLDSTSSFQIPSQNIYRRFIGIASKTSNISKYIHKYEWPTMLCQKFFDLRKTRRELDVQTRTYKSAGRTSMFCLAGSSKVSVWEGWVLAEPCCIPAACGTAFLKGLSPSIELFFLLLSHWPIFVQFCVSVLTSFQPESQLLSQEVRLGFTRSVVGFVTQLHGNLRYRCAYPCSTTVLKLGCLTQLISLHHGIVRYLLGNSWPLTAQNC